MQLHQDLPLSHLHSHSNLSIKNRQSLADLSFITRPNNVLEPWSPKARTRRWRWRWRSRLQQRTYHESEPASASRGGYCQRSRSPARWRSVEVVEVCGSTLVVAKPGLNPYRRRQGFHFSTRLWRGRWGGSGRGWKRLETDGFETGNNDTGRR